MSLYIQHGRKISYKLPFIMVSMNSVLKPFDFKNRKNKNGASTSLKQKSAHQ